MYSGSATDDVKYQLSQVKREPKETDEDLARRLFYLQIEIHSANVGHDLYQGGDFERLDPEIQTGWMERAKKIK